jgi:DNA sulfur modification protein DndD
MKLRELTVRNFMPYKGQQQVEFPTDDFRNVMLVFGDNMRGKTSFLNALRWGFYEQVIGRHSKPIPIQEVPNKEAASEGDWTVEVYIKFEANGHVYDLRRRAEKRANVAVPQRREDFVTQVFLKKDDMPVQGDLVEAEINQIAPQQTSRFFLFDGELLEEYESLLMEGSDQGRRIKEAVEQVLGVPSLIYGRDELTTLLKSARKAQQRDLALVQGLETQAQQQADLTSRQDVLDRDLASLQEKLESTRADIASLDDEIEASQSIHAAKAKLDSLTARQKQIEDYREIKKSERLDLLSDAWRDLIETKLATRREQLEHERDELTRQMSAQAGLELRVQQLRELLATKECPTCFQSLGDEHRSKIGEQLGQLEVELSSGRDCTERLQTLSAELAALGKIRGIKARDRIAQIDRDLQGHEVELTRIENEAAALEDEIRGYDTAEIARKRVLRDGKKHDEGVLLKDIDDRKRDLDKVKADLAVTQKTIEGLSQTRSQRSTIKAKAIAQLETVFGESIERLRDRLRQTVEERATEAFREMTTQKSYRGLRINNNYGLSIVDEHGDEVTVRSAGAEQVVALSLIDGLNRTGRAAGPVVMDTPLGRLDLKHRDNILSYLPKVTSQFALLVHSGEIRRETDLTALAPRIGAMYDVNEINSRHSVIEREQ